ncbi:MAG TPA: 3-phosphoserine/phosphohydroxythreonine transaminase [Chloroflexia bacterium]|nr:3-phosphoserine/phosphohydroxythreonine transaminase [Chloroflexia bacterium]
MSNQALEQAYKDTVTGRIYNFSAGPAVLPLPVLEQAQAELLNYHGAGMSVLEMSHRSAAFEQIIHQAETDLRELLAIPANYKVIFVQGGASLQFAMLPMNLLPASASADYILTGSWSQAALKEAKKLGQTHVSASTEDSNFNRIPDQSEFQLDQQAAYLHFTSNNTIYGTQWKTEPVLSGSVPLACDASSDILSKPVDVSKYGVLYAGTQKNMGVAGATVVIIREDLLERVPAKLPAMLDYKLMAEKESLYNTPPTFSIYISGLVVRWLLDIGGLPEIALRNEAKAAFIYEAIDKSNGFYKGHALPDSRSLMNVTFRLSSEELEKKFVKEATAQGLDGLKGHRSVGGIRASIYNAFPVEGAQALAQFMAEFQRTNG